MAILSPLDKHNCFCFWRRGSVWVKEWFGCLVHRCWSIHRCISRCPARGIVYWDRVISGNHWIAMDHDAEKVEGVHHTLRICVVTHQTCNLKLCIRIGLCNGLCKRLNSGISTITSSYTSLHVKVHIVAIGGRHLFDNETGSQGPFHTMTTKGKVVFVWIRVTGGRLYRCIFDVCWKAPGCCCHPLGTWSQVVSQLSPQ